MYAIITKQDDGTFYALVARNQNNGKGGAELIIVSGYKARFFKTELAAIKSTGKFIGK